MHIGDEAVDRKRITVILQSLLFLHALNEHGKRTLSPFDGRGFVLFFRNLLYRVLVGLLITVLRLSRLLRLLGLIAVTAVVSVLRLSRLLRLITVLRLLNGLTVCGLRRRRIGRAGRLSRLSGLRRIEIRIERSTARLRLRLLRLDRGGSRLRSGRNVRKRRVCLDLLLGIDGLRLSVLRILGL